MEGRIRMKHHQWINITAENRCLFSIFEAFAERKDNTEIVIVIHENHGLTDWLRWEEDERAKHKYLPLCPDFLSGSGPNGGATDSFASDTARMAISQLEAKKITTDLKDLVKYARGLSATEQKVRVIGFCWGSAQTFRYATHDDSLAVAFLWLAIRNIGYAAY